MVRDESDSPGMNFQWTGATWKAAAAVFLILFAGGGPVVAHAAALDPVPTWLEVVVVVSITVGIALAAWAIGDILDESSLVTLILIGGGFLLAAGFWWANRELEALQPGGGIARPWLALTVFAAGLAVVVGWFIGVLRDPLLRRRVVAVLVTGAAVASGAAAALSLVGA